LTIDAAVPTLDCTAQATIKVDHIFEVQNIMCTSILVLKLYCWLTCHRMVPWHKIMFFTVWRNI